MTKRKVRLLLPLVLGLAMIGASFPGGGAGAAQKVRNPALAHITGDESLRGGDSTASLATHQGDDAHRNMQLIRWFPKRYTINSDQAFQGDYYAFAGNYHGLRIHNISDRNNPKLTVDLDCEGPQNDVSVWGDLAFLSVDAPMAFRGTNIPNETCDQAAAAVLDFEDPSTWVGWEGIRVLDISKPTDPQWIASVETDCGSHTHTLVPDLKNNRLILWISSYGLRPGPRCGPNNPGGAPDTHNRIAIVEVPLDNPTGARLLRYKRVVAPVYDKLEGIAGLFATRGCHDINYHTKLKLAAASCMSESQLWRVPNPANPDTTNPIWRFNRPWIDFHHSAGWSADADTVLFNDEEIFGQGCESRDDPDGRLYFLRRSNGQLLGSWTPPRPQDVYCSSHLWNTIPVRGRDIIAHGGYAAGASIVDFSNPRRPREIAFYDPGGRAGHGESWAAYFYNGRVYNNDLFLGWFALRPAAKLGLGGARELNRLNPQTTTWLIRGG